VLWSTYYSSAHTFPSYSSMLEMLLVTGAECVGLPSAPTEGGGFATGSDQGAWARLRIDLWR
jgi:hypothetical protein